MTRYGAKQKLVQDGAASPRSAGTLREAIQETARFRQNELPAYARRHMTLAPEISVATSPIRCRCDR